MTDNELRAAAIGILVYEHLLQAGGGVDICADGKLDLSADIYDGIMEAALRICASVEVGANVALSMDHE